MSKKVTSSDIKHQLFDGTNISSWLLNTRLHLIKNDLWSVTNGTYTQPAASLKPEDQDAILNWNRTNDVALADIILSIAPNHQGPVRKLTSASAAWKKMESSWQVKSLSSKVFMKKKLYSMHLESSDVGTHLTAMRDYGDRLIDMGDTMTDLDLATIILCSLPERFSNLIVALDARDPTEVTTDFVVSRITMEDTRQKEVEAASAPVVPNNIHAEANGFVSIAMGHPIVQRLAMPSLDTLSAIQNTLLVNLNQGITAVHIELDFTILQHSLAALLLLVPQVCLLIAHLSRQHHVNG